MKTLPPKTTYHCSMYDISADFDFDFTLTPGDYLYIAIYLLFVLPFSLLKAFTGKVIHLFDSDTVYTERQKAPSSQTSHSWLAFVTKYF